MITEFQLHHHTVLCPRTRHSAVEQTNPSTIFRRDLNFARQHSYMYMPSRHLWWRTIALEITSFFGHGATCALSLSLSWLCHCQGESVDSFSRGVSSWRLFGASLSELRITQEGGSGLYMYTCCLLYTSPSPRDATLSRMPSSA